MLYILNTQSKTPSAAPWDNEYGHTSGVTFLYLKSGKTVKIVASYADHSDWSIGGSVPVTQDTGLGHRRMPDHTLVAVVSPSGVRGIFPTTKSLPFWVCK